jgi:hypothetical protein
VRKLVEARIREILIVTGTEHMGDVVGLLGSGVDFGCEFTYRVQDQAGGIAQVNRAVEQMDQVTQSNAALVEQAATAAASLQEQAARLMESVSVFKLDGEAAPAPPGRQAQIIAMQARPGAAPRAGVPGPRPLIAVR